jgi:uncharacterized repeat protein (TIGR03806 family)
VFVSVRDRQPEAGLIAYSVNALLWSDGAFKERFMAVPDGGKIGFTTGGNGWNFPEGTVLVKTFLLEFEPGNSASRRPGETRLLTRQQNEWAGYSYVWNDEATDAVLAGKEGIDRPFVIRDPAAPGGHRTQSWHYPSRAECMVCHSRAANFVLGLSEAQMDRDHDYGGVVDNQFRTLEHIGLFTAALPGRSAARPPLVDPSDPRAPLERRVRSYLHANCAICHVEAGGGNAAINLSIASALEKMRLIDVLPMQDSFGIDGARIVAPGHPERSTLLERIRRRGPGQMPPLASSLVDDEAVSLVRQWIAGLAPPQGRSDP